MELERLTITRKQFDALTPDEQVFFVMMLSFLNDIHVVMQSISAARNGLLKGEPCQRSAQGVQLSFFVTLKAGILYTAWESIRDLFPPLDDVHKYELPEPSRQALSKLNAYFAKGTKAPLVEFIRHTHAFHRAPKLVKRGIKSASKVDSLDIYMAVQNFCCPLADHMAKMAMFQHADPNSAKDGINKLLWEVQLDVWDMVTNFAHGFCSTIVKKLKPVHTKIQITTLAATQQELPYFVEAKAAQGSAP